MSVLSNLARVIRTSSREECSEVYAYACTHATDIRAALGLETSEYFELITGCICAALPARLTLAMKEARKGARETKVAAMQRAADIMGHSLKWDGDRCEIDIAPFLPAIVAGPELLAFPRWDMAVSLDVLRRFRAQVKSNSRLTSWRWATFIDAEGLHIRWMNQGRSGGINVRAQRIHVVNRSRAFEDMIVCEPGAMHGPIERRAALEDVSEAAE